MKSLLRSIAFAIALFAAPALCAQNSQDDYQREFKKGYDALVAGRYEEGIASMKRCLELNPADSTPAYNLGCAYSLTKELDTAFEWLGKSVDMGFVFSTSRSYTLLVEEDKDLAAARADARFAALVERCKAQTAAVDAFVAQPVVYVPAALESAELVPLLVVLHDAGATKDTLFAKGPWKQLADELGYALVLPSGKVPTQFQPKFDPTLGMTWFTDANDYGQSYYKFEKPVTDAVSAFRKQRKVDPARVHIVGLGIGASPAFNIALSQPGLYKGVVTYNGAPNTTILGSKPANASKQGLKVSMIFTDKAQGQLATISPAEYGNLTANFERYLKSISLQGSVVRCPAPADAGAVAIEPIKAALQAFNAPAEPAPAPATTPKEQ